MTTLDIPSLVAAAMAARPAELGWDEDSVTGAILATQNAVPPWPAGRVWWELAMQIGDPDGHPRSLIRAANPVSGNGPPPPPDVRDQ